MTKTIRMIAIGTLIASSGIYAASTAACAGCHGQNFEKVALGKSKIVKDMSKDDIIAALKGYKDGTYGGAMKGTMKGQVANLSDADIEDIANQIKGGSAEATAEKKPEAAAEKKPEEAAAEKKPEAAEAKKLVNINEGLDNPDRIAKEDLGIKDKQYDETALLLNKTEDAELPEVDYKRPAAGSAPKFERAFVNAPPMVPHDVEGMLPITKANNACLGCHMPDVAKGVNATPIPPSHFTNFRPDTAMKDGKVVKEGKVVGLDGDIGNSSDIVLAEAKKMDKLYQGRFNCSQCHAPQSNVKPVVGNTFQADFGKDGALKSKSNLIDVMNSGVE